MKMSCQPASHNSTKKRTRIEKKQADYEELSETGENCSQSDVDTNIQTSAKKSKRTIIEPTPLNGEKRAKKMTSGPLVELEASRSEKIRSKKTPNKKDRKVNTSLEDPQAGLERKKTSKEGENVDLNDDDGSTSKENFTLEIQEKINSRKISKNEKEKLTVLLYELMNSEMFVGSNFFSIQGYEITEKSKQGNLQERSTKTKEKLEKVESIKCKKLDESVTENVVSDSQEDVGVTVKERNKRKKKRGKSKRDNIVEETKTSDFHELQSEEQTIIEPNPLDKGKRAKKRKSEKVEKESDVPTGDRKHKKRNLNNQDEKEVKNQDEITIVEPVALKKRKRAKEMTEGKNVEVKLDAITNDEGCIKNKRIKKDQKDKSCVAGSPADSENGEEKSNIQPAHLKNEERQKKRKKEIEVVNLKDNVAENSSPNKTYFTLQLQEKLLSKGKNIVNKEKLTAFLYELINSDMFAGSNFFAIQGYDE